MTITAEFRSESALIWLSNANNSMGMIVFSMVLMMLEFDLYRINIRNPLHLVRLMVYLDAIAFSLYYTFQIFQDVIATCQHRTIILIIAEFIWSFKDASKYGYIMHKALTMSGFSQKWPFAVTSMLSLLFYWLYMLAHYSITGNDCDAAPPPFLVSGNWTLVLLYAYWTVIDFSATIVMLLKMNDVITSSTEISNTSIHSIAVNEKLENEVKVFSFHRFREELRLLLTIAGMGAISAVTVLRVARPDLGIPVISRIVFVFSQLLLLLGSKKVEARDIQLKSMNSMRRISMKPSGGACGGGSANAINSISSQSGISQGASQFSHISIVSGVSNNGASQKLFSSCSAPSLQFRASESIEISNHGSGNSPAPPSMAGVLELLMIRASENSGAGSSNKNMSLGSSPRDSKATSDQSQQSSAFVSSLRPSASFIMKSGNKPKRSQSVAAGTSSENGIDQLDSTLSTTSTTSSYIAPPPPTLGAMQRFSINPQQHDLETSILGRRRSRQPSKVSASTSHDLANAVQSQQHLQQQQQQLLPQLHQKPRHRSISGRKMSVNSPTLTSSDSVLPGQFNVQRKIAVVVAAPPFVSSFSGHQEAVDSKTSNSSDAVAVTSSIDLPKTVSE